MKREMKFRCFDLTRDLMVYESFLINWKGELYNRQGNPNYIIMQSAELTDEAGKEIFEGDLIRNDEGENVYEIIFYRGAFRAAVLPRKIRVYDIGINQFDNIKIIGNVYENPELAQ